MLGNRAREYRLRNAVKIFMRTRQMLADAGLSPDSIAPRLFLPAIEAASIEDDESLQERWAALLANAADPSHRKTISLSYVEALKQLTPEQAIFLDRIYDRVMRNSTFPPRMSDIGVKIGAFNCLLDLFAWGRSPQSVYTDDSLRARAVAEFDNLIRLGILSRVLFDEDTMRNAKHRASCSQPKRSP